MTDILHDLLTQNMWPCKSPDLNALNYYMWCLVEKETKQGFHNTTDFLKDAITLVLSNINTKHVGMNVNYPCPDIEASIAAKSGYIEEI